MALRKIHNPAPKLGKRNQRPSTRMPELGIQAFFLPCQLKQQKITLNLHIILSKYKTNIAKPQHYHKQYHKPNVE